MAKAFRTMLAAAAAAAFELTGCSSGDTRPEPSTGMPGTTAGGEETAETPSESGLASEEDVPTAKAVDEDCGEAASEEASDEESEATTEAAQPSQANKADEATKKIQRPNRRRPRTERQGEAACGEGTCA